jgi:hypothetical protein
MTRFNVPQMGAKVNTHNKNRGLLLPAQNAYLHFAGKSFIISC